MRTTFDQYLFTQTALDSGSLTMLGAVIHQLPEAGEYRGTVHHGEDVESTFYIKVDKSSPVAQVNIDLAQPRQQFRKDSDCCSGRQAGNEYTVNPKGFTLFHVSNGAGGYYVHLRKADEDPKQKVFDSRQLEEGDVFSAVIIRPGAYSIANASTKAKGEVSVAYPKIGKLPYRPPKPVRVDCTPEYFEPKKIELQPGQAILFHFKTRSRIRIELTKPDDGPRRAKEAARVGWQKLALPKEQA
jgi:hypothetical protein